MTVPSSASFADRVVRWQGSHGRRDLPWQGTRDTYRIWVSEIMLQQTQVAAVIPYYVRFLERFPDIEALASAPSAEVMAAWAGLGYYSRARNLHKCAQTVVEQHGAQFPRTARALVDLPGIGRSTAAAIAAFAFGERAAILDGNVKRVFARHFGVDGYPGETGVERRLWQVAEAELPATGIEPYTQGLMDLGATVCVRSRPRCQECPLAASCIALSQGRVAELPAPRPVKVRPVRHTAVAIICDAGGAFLLETRPPSGIWGGLMSLPEFEADADDPRLVSAIAARYSLDVELRERLPEVRHEFTHYSLIMHPRIARIRGAAGAAGGAARMVQPGAFEDVALPAPVRRLLQQLDAGP
ncbi:MAG: A/G-specific adenine glycosylase [Burkholderiaceae bacterium]